MKTTIKALLVILTFAFFSCQKDAGLGVTSNTSTDLSIMQLKSATLAVNDVAVESASEEASNETFFYGEYERMLRALAHLKGSKKDLFAGKGNMHYINGQRPVVSIDTAEAGYPIVISIDYGTGKETDHGKVISGKVTIEISGPKGVDGTTRTITYQDCVIDSIGINGKSIETFNGDNATTRKMTVSSEVDFTLPDGTIIHRVGNTVREWLEGLATPLVREDDKIQVTGTIEVTSSKGDKVDKYSRVIVEPLIRLGDCHHPVQGVVQFNKNGIEIASLDYGTGVCDNKAILTTNGTDVEIVLKEQGMPKAKTEGKHEASNKGKKNGGH